MKKVDRTGSNNSMWGKPSGMRGKPHPNKGGRIMKSSCPVMCEGIYFASVGDAEKAYGKKLRNKFDDPKYPEFYRLRKKTLRPKKSN
jgi:hypothetical protein